jgi:phosphoesterase RecJ-like protein
MRADCDALGSELVMAAVLTSLGKKARVINGDAVPPHIGFIDPGHKVQVLGHDVMANDLPQFDVAMVLDTSSWTQLGPLADVIRKSSAKRVVIDHHVSGDDLGAVEFKDTSAEATGRLVFEAAQALGAPITPEMAMLLFAAIATDTGWFRFSSVNEKTYLAVAELVRIGANPGEIFAALYEQNSLARLKLQGRILSKIESSLGGRVLYVLVTQMDLDTTEAEPTDTEDMVNRLLTVAGVQVAILFQELEPDRTKVSIRSRSKVDVRAIAEQFNGGGHTAAAGIKFRGTMDEARVAVLDALRKVMG